MPTPRPILLALALTALLAAPRATAHPSTPQGAKAPVVLAMTGTPDGETLTLTLTVGATAFIPRAVARFVLPKGVTPSSGASEQDLGALAAGARVTARLTVRQAPGEAPPTIFAGVDCQMASGVRLHAATTWPTTTPKTTARPAGLKRLDGARATPARPRP